MHLHGNKKIETRKNVVKNTQKITSKKVVESKNKKVTVKKDAAWLISSLCPLTRYNKKNTHVLSFNVRVLLDELVSGKTDWILESEHGFIVKAFNSSERIGYRCRTLTITVQHGALFINRKKVIAKHIVITAARGNIITFNDKNYAGSFSVLVDKPYGYLINELDLEDYVGCVLYAESWPGWPLAVNKAFAIASRSYVMARIVESEKQKKPFHIKNTNIHQTYKGVHTNSVLKEAVDQTRGLVLTYNKKPIEAMFDCCCGGVIPAYIADVDFKKAPYLARKYRCNYCKSVKIYTWKAEYSTEEFEKILQQAGYPIKRIKKIKILKKDKAGLAQTIGIYGSKTITITGKQIYSLCSNIKSYSFDIEKKGKIILVTGRGYGHHLGICQWGARSMLDSGKNYADILNFYYPGTVLMELRM